MPAASGSSGFSASHSSSARQCSDSYRSQSSSEAAMRPIGARPAVSNFATVSGSVTQPSSSIPGGSGHSRQYGSPTATNPPLRTAGASAASVPSRSWYTNDAPRHIAASHASFSSGYALASPSTISIRSPSP